MHEKVTFTAMEHGTRDDYELVSRHDAQERSLFPGRVMQWLSSMDGPSPYLISRLDHSLQSATRAERDNASDDTVLMALLHDIGDVLCPANHSQVAAALLRPYISKKNHWIVLHHGLFQGYYYFHHLDMDRDVRERYRGHEYYDDCVAFCHNWDQTSFDPKYKSYPLEHFEPLIHQILGQEPKSFAF
ncbi:MAG: HD domain-containing protein [Pseudomonadota bacterium]